MLRCYGRRFIKSDQSNRIGNAPQKCTGGWINSEILWGWKCSRHGILIWNQAIFMASDMITIINGGQSSIDHGQVGIELVESSIWYSRNDIKWIYKCFTAKLSVQSCLWKIYKPLKSNGGPPSERIPQCQKPEIFRYGGISTPRKTLPREIAQGQTVGFPYIQYFKQLF